MGASSVIISLLLFSIICFLQTPGIGTTGAFFSPYNNQNSFLTTTIYFCIQIIFMGRGKKQAIKWHSDTVQVADLIENPKNPKKPDAKGKQRLLKSINKWGIVIGGICNTDNMLIDGHSRKDVFEELGIKEVEVRKPDRKLSPAEYKELNAIYDLAKGGQTDMQILEEEMSEEFFEEWDLDRNDSKPEIKNVEIQPYHRTHVLLSFPPEKMIELQELLQKIKNFSFVEYEQSAN
jgi:hypothetical protein